MMRRTIGLLITLTLVLLVVLPAALAASHGWRLRFLKRLADQGARVRLTGWLMLDSDHPDQIGKARGGLWEIHPVTKIEVFSGGRWIEL
jgi:hypothetical protein